MCQTLSPEPHRAALAVRLCEQAEPVSLDTGAGPLAPQLLVGKSPSWPLHPWSPIACHPAVCLVGAHHSVAVLSAALLPGHRAPLPSSFMCLPGIQQQLLRRPEALGWPGQQDTSPASTPYLTDLKTGPPPVLCKTKAVPGGHKLFKSTLR